MDYQNDDFIYIQNLVGNITNDDLSCVDVYVHNNLGIFIPSIGFCKYAIKPNHTHPSYSFIIPLYEEDFFIAPTIHVPHDCYLCYALSPDIPHSEPISESFHRYIAIFITKDFFENQLLSYIPTNNKKFLWTQSAVNKNILSYIKIFMNEYEEYYSNRNDILNSLSLLITNEIIRSLLNIKYNDSNKIAKFEIKKAIDYMNSNFSEKITLKTLCKLTNMSESNFNKLFKKEMEISPIKYLINIRIKKAKKFLRNTDLSITEVSMKCGFYSVSHFSSCFTNIVKLSPTEYQNLFNNE